MLTMGRAGKSERFTPQYLAVSKQNVGEQPDDTYS
jgi:hypothetical protein